MLASNPEFTPQFLQHAGTLPANSMVMDTDSSPDFVVSCPTTDPFHWSSERLKAGPDQGCVILDTSRK
ncbi:hypothetical protein [Microvirga aerophila]|uniref:hypothetical protein n=1 Tax=Microvirga aerophila TaxID=670291 RepID=UPI0013B3A6F1|nr:hypothetical protein [Microvirga aerophila]